MTNLTTKSLLNYKTQYEFTLLQILLKQATDHYHNQLKSFQKEIGNCFLMRSWICLL